MPQLMPIAVDAAKTVAIVFVASIVQVSILNAISPFGGSPDLVLVTLVAVSLLRGSVFGAGAGFLAGMIIDTATLATLGVTALLLTLAGYWIGRYGETTGRDRAHAPLVAVAVITILYSAGALVLNFMLGEDVSPAAVFDALLPTMLWNVLLAVPVYALCRKAFGRRVDDRVQEVELLG
jgi:rod shape-determining protein MreD